MGYGISSEAMIKALEDTGGLISLAARKLRCSQKTIENRAARVQAVRQVIIDARTEITDDAELALKAAVLRGEPWAVMLVLKTQGRERGYSEKTQVEVTGANGRPLELAVVERIVDVTTTPDQLNQSSVRLLS